MTDAQREGRIAVVYDLDETLVDTGDSYRAAIARTVASYPAIEGPPVTVRDILALKAARGFNNDWDLTVALLRAAAAGVPYAHAATRPEQLAPEACVDRALVVRIFQEHYLGGGLFEALEGDALAWTDGTPLIDRERLLVAPDALAALSRRVPLAIATGRPRAEALYALSRAGVGDLFTAVVTHDCCEEEAARRADGGRLGKPNPWPLEEARRRLEARVGAVERVFYVGDLPDDMRAARAAGFIGLAVVPEPDPTREAALREAGARHILRASIPPDEVLAGSPA